MIYLESEGGRIRLSHEDMNALTKREAAQIGERLKMIRYKNELDVQRFAEIVGEETIFIKRFENGEQMPPEHYLRSVCEKTGVEYPWLADGRGGMFAGDRAVGNLVYALTECASEFSDRLELGQDPDAYANARDAAEAEDLRFQEMAERFKDVSGFREIQSQANLMAGAWQLEGFEHGMRYGARLVFQLLIGQDGKALDRMLLTAVEKLRRDLPEDVRQSTAV